MNSTTRALIGTAALVIIAGCGSAATTAVTLATPAPATATPSTAAPTASASTVPTPPPTIAPTPTAAPPPATVMTGMAAGHGAVLVASNGRTLYVFAMDRAGAAMSECTGGCIATWPPLTVPQGMTPSAAAGVGGQFGTIMRTDGKGMQVTDNGRPLYIFSGDGKPGDANGNYPGWSVVAVTGA